MRVLAGDVGGTNSRFAIVETEGYRVIEERVYPSADQHELTAVVRKFVLETDATFDAACVGVPGPVRDGRATTTNLRWVIDVRSIADDLGVPAAVINDVEAAAWSLDVLPPTSTDVILVGAADAPHGNRALIAPGTGLGQAGLFWDGSSHQPFPSEGGHSDFAPGDELEWDLRRELVRRFGRVSWERVLSGPGLVAIHRFLSTRHGAAPACPGEALGDDANAGPAITRAARASSCEVCVESVARFCRLLGAQAGNLALDMLAIGGVWVGGGMAPEIVPELRAGAFTHAFLSKGRMREVLQQIPVTVILDEMAGLRGAARFATGLVALATG